MAKAKVVVRGAFDYDGDAVSTDTGVACLDESLAVQSERDEVDINRIVGKFLNTGVLEVRQRPPSAGDFTHVKDMRESLQLIRDAEEAFMEQPADIRARFHHDPVEFVEFCSNPDNLEELRKLKLAPPKEETPASVAGLVPAAVPAATV